MKKNPKLYVMMLVCPFLWGGYATAPHVVEGTNKLTGLSLFEGLNIVNAR